MKASAVRPLSTLGFRPNLAPRPAIRAVAAGGSTPYAFGLGLPSPKSPSSMPSTVTKTTPLQLAEQALHSAEAHLRQAREEMPDSYEERLAILEANTEAVLDGVKRVCGGRDA